MRNEIHLMLRFWIILDYDNVGCTKTPQLEPSVFIGA